MAKSMSKEGKAIQKAKRRLESVFRNMDYEERRKRPSPPQVKGKRAIFLEKYKEDGYETAKKEINADFEKEVYNDSILKRWIEEDNEK